MSMKFKMSEEEYHDYDNNSIGLCINCGEERSYTEPDARKYDCPGCEENEVYGVPELLLMGRVIISEDEE